MKPVNLNATIFDHVGPFKYVYPTLRNIVPTDTPEFTVGDVFVIYQLDYDKATERFQLCHRDLNTVMWDVTLKLSYAGTDLAGVTADVLKALHTERSLQIQCAFDRFVMWFNGEVSDWLRQEAERDRIGVTPCSPDFCAQIIIGH